MNVHLYGNVSILEETAVWQSVERLVKKHEQVSKSPISLNALPDSIQGMLKAVTGFELNTFNDKFFFINFPNDFVEDANILMGY